MSAPTNDRGGPDATRGGAAVELSGQRNRLVYALAVVLVIGLGLLLRSGGAPFPGAVVKYGGVALWALVVFLLLGLATPVASTARLGGVAVAISWCVEFLQLYHSSWVDSIRATRVGHLVLGSTFNSPDLLAYCVGIGLGAAAESVFAMVRRCGRGAS